MTCETNTGWIVTSYTYIRKVILVDRNKYSFYIWYLHTLKLYSTESVISIASVLGQAVRCTTTPLICYTGWTRPELKADHVSGKIWLCCSEILLNHGPVRTHSPRWRVHTYTLMLQLLQSIKTNQEWTLKEIWYQIPQFTSTLKILSPLQATDQYGELWRTQSSNFIQNVVMT